MTKDPFDFTTWIAESVSIASLEVIKKAMKTLESLGSSSISASFKHSFYISYVTKDFEVIMPDFLKSDYPDVITIVLENQFENLKVVENGFFVSLSFNNKLQDLFIPFKAIVNFSDRALNLNIPMIYDNKRLLDDKLEVTKKEKTLPKKSPKNSENSNIIEFRKN